MKKIDFKKANLKGVDGKIATVDLDYQGLANFIFNQTKDLGELELARELYKNGMLDVDARRAQALKNYIQGAFSASVHEALFPVLDEIINSKKQKSC